MSKLQTKLILWLLAVFMLAGLHPANAVDKRFQYNELVCGANSPSCSDTINRLTLVEHNSDGTHKSFTAVKDPYVDVRAYGADPTGVADSATAISNAITYALSVNRPVYIPAGTYLIGSKITVTLPAESKTGFAMRGDGRGRSILKYTGAASIGSLLEIAHSGTSWAINVKLEGFKIDLTSAPSGTNGLRITDGIWRSRFNDIYITRNAETPRSGYGIYIGNSDPAGVGNFDLKFNDLYVTNFQRNFYAVGTSLSGNTITDLSVSDYYISGGDYNVYIDHGLAMYFSGGQVESANNYGFYFATCETANIVGGAIESPVGGAVGVGMDANTASVVITGSDFYNNSGGHFITNGKMGHHYKTSNSEFIYPPGAAIRMEADASYKSYIKFFKNGLTDVRLMADNAVNQLLVTDASSNAYYKFNISSKVFEFAQTGSLFRVQTTDASPSYIQFFQNGVKDARITAGTGYATIGFSNGSNSPTFTFDTVNKNIIFDGHRIEYGTAAPMTGTYTQGDLVFNTAPAELGTAGSKYIIDGWRCVSGGNPGTWLQRRVLTGN